MLLDAVMGMKLGLWPSGKCADLERGAEQNLGPQKGRSRQGYEENYKR
jgi:hypothetical protein